MNNEPRKRRSDIGKKRKKYNSSLRQLKAFDRQAAKQLAREKKVVGRIRDEELAAYIGSDVVEFKVEDFKIAKTRQQYRVEARIKLLDKLIGKSRKCPTCGQGPLLKSKQWVVRGKLVEPRAVCRKCHCAKPFGEKT